MPKIVCIHSFRDGVGKTTLAANIAALLVTKGQRVCLVDTNFQHPDVHECFALDQNRAAASLSDFLLSKGAIGQAVYDVTESLAAGANGRCYVVPAGRDSDAIASIRDEGYDPYLLRDGLDELIDSLKLDFLMLDTRAGLDEQTLPLLAITDVLLVIMELNKEDYQGTGVVIDVATKIDVPAVTLIVNNVTGLIDVTAIREEVERAYKCRVAAVIPQEDALKAAVHAGFFAVKRPESPVTTALGQAASQLIDWSL